MIQGKLTSLMGGAVLGCIIGAAITVPAHYDNPFLTSPGVFLGLIVAAISSIVSLFLMVLLKKRGSKIMGLCACSLAILAVLVVVPLLWPYPQSEGPKPLAHETQEQ